MLVEQRLIVADTSMLPRDLGSFAVWLRDLRRQFPDRPIIGFADNFHHYDIRAGGPSDGEGRLQYISRYAKDLTIKYHCTLVMTMELPKDSLKPGIRPRVPTIKGSASMAYEASANIGVYNDMKDFGATSQLVWEDKGDMEAIEGPSGEKLTQAKKKPVIELVFDKSKIYKGFDGVIYYRLDPATGRYDEEPAHRQKEWELLALQGAVGGETKTDYEAPDYAGGYKGRFVGDLPWSECIAMAAFDFYFQLRLRFPSWTSPV